LTTITVAPARMATCGISAAGHTTFDVPTDSSTSHSRARASAVSIAPGGSSSSNITTSGRSMPPQLLHTGSPAGLGHSKYCRQSKQRVRRNVPCSSRMFRLPAR
jgi:hypothetical protein